MGKNEVVLIDVEKVAMKATGGKKLPKFVINFLKKFVHEEDFNTYFREGTLGYEFIEGFLNYIDVKVDVFGEENIPEGKLLTFASNHPLGGVDAGFETGWFARRYNGKLAVPANDFMMSVKQVGEYLIPVNKMGRQGRGLGAILDEAFTSAKQILFFPAGLCSRRINGVITDLPWKKTFITKSRETKRDIVPVWFSGRNSRRFYFISDLCRILKLKTNYAMFTLPDELFRCRGKRFKMVIGKPIPWQTFTDEKSDLEWSNYVREQVYALKQD